MAFFFSFLLKREKQLRELQTKTFLHSHSTPCNLSQSSASKSLSRATGLWRIRRCLNSDLVSAQMSENASQQCPLYSKYLKRVYEQRNEVTWQNARPIFAKGTAQGRAHNSLVNYGAELILCVQFYMYSCCTLKQLYNLILVSSFTIYLHFWKKTTLRRNITVICSVSY